MNIKEVERVVGSLQSHLFRNANSFSIGMLKSHFKGSGLQFKEHQVYSPGDDVRFIDWNLTAKSNNTYIKTFEEERNVEIIVVIDITPTMFIGYKNVSKLQAAIEIACLLYLLAEKTKDQVKTVIMLDKATILPSTSGQKGIVLIISVLERMGVLDEHGKVNVNFQFDQLVEEKKKLGLIKSFVARRKETVYLSDFSHITDFETLNKLIYRRNMHCFKVSSPVDDAMNRPFSIFARFDKKSSMLKGNTKKRESLLKGKWKEISLKERYLELFVHEML